MSSEKINSIEQDMHKVKTEISYVRKDINLLSKKVDGLCLKMDNGFVRKEIFEMECNGMKQDIGFVRGIIFSVAGVIALSVFGAILSLVIL